MLIEIKTRLVWCIPLECKKRIKRRVLFAELCGKVVGILMKRDREQGLSTLEAIK